MLHNRQFAFIAGSAIAFLDGYKLQHDRFVVWSTPRIVLSTNATVLVTGLEGSEGREQVRGAMATGSSSR